MVVTAHQMMGVKYIIEGVKNMNKQELVQEMQSISLGGLCANGDMINMSPVVQDTTLLCPVCERDTMVVVTMDEIGMRQGPICLVCDAKQKGFTE